MKRLQKIKKIFATLALAVIVFVSMPTPTAHAGAMAVTDGGNTAAGAANLGTNIEQLIENIKEGLIEAGKAILKSVAKKLLAKVTQATVSWINSGFEGKPLFLENPKGFFTDLANDELKNVIAVIGYDPINYPFGRDISISIIENTKDYFAQNAKYSLDQVIGGDQNRIEFQGNFALGGWSAYTALARPNNNRFGSQLLAKKYTTKISAGLRVDKADVIKTEISQGQGFLSQKICLDPADYTPPPADGFQYTPPADGAAVDPGTSGPINPDYNANGNGPWAPGVTPPATQGSGYADQYAEYQNSHECRRWGTQTPGSVISSKIMTAVTSGERQGELAQAMGSSISAIFDALLNKLVDEGLSALGGSDDIPPQEDTFNYQGYGFNGNAGTSTGSSVWGTADQVVDLAKFRKDVSDTTPCTPPDDPADPTKPCEPGALERLNQAIIYQEQIVNTIKSLPAKVRGLDACIPGPNRYWKIRLDREVRVESESARKYVDDGNSDAEKTEIRQLRNFDYAVKVFKDYIENSMLLQLPSSALYMEEVDKFIDYEGDIERATKTKLDYKTLQSKTASIKNIIFNPAFDAYLTDPLTHPLTDSQKSTLKIHYTRYLAMRREIPTEDGLAIKENELDKVKIKATRFDTLTTQCLQERTDAAWGPPNAFGNSPKLDIVKADGTNAKEIELLCGWPIEGGYSYGRKEIQDEQEASGNTDINGWIEGSHEEGDGYGYDIPIVNARNWHRKSFALDCTNIFPGSIIDYTQEDEGL